MKAKIDSIYERHPRLFALVVALVLGCLTVLLSSRVSSLIYAYIPVNPTYNDATLFAVLGRSLVEGKTPYVEIFDHKGLYLFYYMALGYGLGGRVGMFFVQYLFIGSFLYIFFEICREYGFGWGRSTIACALFFAVYSLASQSPSDCEMGLPFIALMFYFYVKAMKGGDNRYFMIGNAFAGVTAGLAINIRPSDAMIPLSVVIFYAINRLMDKGEDGATKAKRILLNAAIVVGCIALISVPPFVHAYAGGFLKEMVDVVIVSNFRYVGSSNDRSAATVWLWRGIIFAGAALLLLLLFLCRKKMLREEITFHWVSISIVGLIQFAIAYYPHYLLIVVPWLIVYVIRIMGLFSFKKVMNIIATSLVGLSCIGAVSIPVATYYSGQFEADRAITTYVNESIPEAERRGHTLAYLCTASIYLNSGIDPSFPDFAIQDNHHRLGIDALTMEAFVAHLDSGECHYIILWNSDDLHNEIYDYVIDGKSLDGTAGTSKFEFIEDKTHEGSKYISIYHYVG